jgi:hypothetical protein
VRDEEDLKKNPQPKELAIHAVALMQFLHKNFPRDVVELDLSDGTLESEVIAPIKLTTKLISKSMPLDLFYPNLPFLIHILNRIHITSASTITIKAVTRLCLISGRCSTDFQT